MKPPNNHWHVVHAVLLFFILLLHPSAAHSQMTAFTYQGHLADNGMPATGVYEVGAFATGGGQVGGKEFAVVSLVMFMINNRIVVAGPLYENPKTGSVWADVGAAAITGPLDPGVSEAELDGAPRLGERVARLALKLKGASAP